PKVEDENRLVFDREKMIESGNPIFKVPFEIIDIETMLKGSNSENAIVGLNEDVGEIAPDGKAKIVRIELGNVREKHDEKRKYTYHREYEFRDEVSCCDEHLNRVYESGMKIERNEKGKVDVMNRVDELGDNEVKGKEVKVKNDVEEV
ncbi:9482_t:CDS:2, partial [Racocetra fulgida]